METIEKVFDKLPSEENPLLEGANSGITVVESGKEQVQQGKFKINPREMIIYSEIMKPKFLE